MAVNRTGAAHLSPPGRAEGRVLLLGDLALLTGGDRPRVGDGFLGSQLVHRGLRPTDRGLDVDVLWHLDAALRTAAESAAAGRLQDYQAIVIAVAVGDAPRIRQGLVDLVPVGEHSTGAGPAIGLLLVSPDLERAPRQAVAAFSRAYDMVRDLGLAARVTVVPARSDDRGVLVHPDLAAAALIRTAPPSPGAAPSDPIDDDISEVAIDRSLIALRGRTGHLRRALILAQNSFEAPFAQLNLVSRGTLRSLAFIGRSSDGLQESLSAETFRAGRPLLVADTRAGDRFLRIPETHGPDAIRYYVGHPVHDQVGHRIGVLCVLDTDPRPVCPGDDELIRDVALLAEGELGALLRSSP